MLGLDNPVDALVGIGPQSKKLLEKLEIFTVEDLLYHFPFRYEDYRIKKNINYWRVGERAVTKAKLEKVDNVYTKFGKRITIATLRDETKEGSAVWFNQHYLKKTLRVGEEYNFSGKVDFFNRKPFLISPDFELFNLNNPHTSG